MFSVLFCNLQRKETQRQTLRVTSSYKFVGKGRAELQKIEKIFIRLSILMLADSVLVSKLF